MVTERETARERDADRQSEGVNKRWRKVRGKTFDGFLGWVSFSPVVFG